MDDLIAEFRLVFSEFADESVFPQSVVYFWMNQKLKTLEYLFSNISSLHHIEFYGSWSKY